MDTDCVWRPEPVHTAGGRECPRRPAVCLRARGSHYKHGRSEVSVKGNSYKYLCLKILFSW